MDAIGKIYDQTDWSFQRTITYANWLCPGQIANVGTFNVQPYNNVVTADATASQALATGLANAGVFVTTLQFRSPSYSIYNIVQSGTNGSIAYLTAISLGSGQTPGTYIVGVADLTGGGTGATVSITVNSSGTVTAQPIVITPGAGYQTPSVALAAGGTPATFNVFMFTQLTLDRPWLEPLNGPINYMIYQVYFVSPVPDFRKFIEIRDTTNADRLNFWSLTQAELSLRDPQRTEFSDPSYVVPAGVDQRPGTSTPGYQMFELWPHQLSYVPYSFSFRRRGLLPVTYADWQTMTPPYPITDELVRWRAEEILYQYAEAQKDKTTSRGAGANFMLLAQMAGKEYLSVFDKILAIDMNLNGEMLTRIEGRGRHISNEPYSNNLGQLNIGGWPSRG